VNCRPSARSLLRGRVLGKRVSARNSGLFSRILDLLPCADNPRLAEQFEESLMVLIDETLEKRPAIAGAPVVDQILDGYFSVFP